jgi:hypothetical protein
VATLIIVAVVIIMAMITKKSQDRFLFCTYESVRKMPQFSYKGTPRSPCRRAGEMGVDGGGGGGSARTKQKNSVYDTRTITPAKLTFEPFITFLESATCRN